MSGFSLVIVGAGYYGSALALAASCNAKSSVRLIDISEERLSYSGSYFQKWMNDDSKMTRVTTQYAYEVMERISWSQDLRDTAYANFVFESIDEDLVLKNDVIQQIENYVSENTVIASTTNHISIGKLARNTKAPYRILGMHFPQYPVKYNACEVVAHSGSSKEAIKQACDYAVEMSFRPAVCLDNPGFIANRAIYLYINEAIFSLHEGVAKKEDIDSSIRRGLFNGLGPLEMADYIGLDTLLEGLRIFHKESGDDKFRPCPLLAKMVEAGILGRKTNQGFFQYNEGEFLGRKFWREQSFNGFDQKMKEILKLEKEIKNNYDVFYNTSHVDYLERFSDCKLRDNIKDPEDLYALDSPLETREGDIELMKQFFDEINQLNDEVLRGTGDQGDQGDESEDIDFSKDEGYEELRKVWAIHDVKHEDMNEELEIFKQSEAYKEVMFAEIKDEYYEDIVEAYHQKNLEKKKEEEKKKEKKKKRDKMRMKLKKKEQEQEEKEEEEEQEEKEEEEQEQEQEQEEQEEKEEKEEEEEEEVVVEEEDREKLEEEEIEEEIEREIEEEEEEEEDEEEDKEEDIEQKISKKAKRHKYESEFEEMDLENPFDAQTHHDREEHFEKLFNLKLESFMKQRKGAYLEKKGPTPK